MPGSTSSAARACRSSRCASAPRCWAWPSGSAGISASCPTPRCPRVFAQARVIALPYRWIEGSGILATALARGVPPVVTAVGTFPELCTEYDLGAPVPPGDPAALALGLVRALTDPGLRARAIAGMERARSELAWERTAQDDARAVRARAGRAARAADVLDAQPADGSLRPRARGTLRRMRLRFCLLALLLCALAPSPAPRRPRRPARSRSWPARAAACRAGRARLHAGARPRRCPRGRAQPRRALALRRRGHAGSVTAFSVLRERPAGSSSTSAPDASPRSRRTAAAPRARSRAPRRSSSRRTTCTSTWRPRRPEP